MMLDDVRTQFIFNLAYYLLKALLELVVFTKAVQSLMAFLDQFWARAFVSAVWVSCLKMILEREE